MTETYIGTLQEKSCPNCETFEECYNNKCTCRCHTTKEKIEVTVPILPYETYQERVELFEKELERIKKVFPRYYVILITKYKEIFSGT